MMVCELNNILHSELIALLATGSVAGLTRVVPWGAEHFQQLA